MQVGRHVHKDANGEEKHRFADKQCWKIHFQGFNGKAANLVCFLFHRGETNVRSRANDFFIVMKRMYAHEGKLPESSLNCKNASSFAAIGERGRVKSSGVGGDTVGLMR